MDDNKSEKPSLKIIEWNINCCKITSEKHKKWAKIAHCINDINPDILVLTECGESFNCDNFKQLLDDSSNWDIQVNKDDKHIDDNYNFIAILVNKKNFEKIKIERLDFQKTFCKGNERAKIHPDRIAVKITLNNTDITILGVRMLTSFKGDEKNNLRILEQRILQNIQLVHDIQALEPDIIIGDFNTCSEMESLNIYNAATWKNKNIIWEGKGKERKLKPKFCKWNEWLNNLVESNENYTDVLANFCNLIGSENKKYQYWAGDKRTPFSYKPIRSNISTAPDTLIWRSEPSEDDNVKPNPRYYPEIVQGQKPSVVVKDWPSDHCMLIADIEIPSKQHLAEDS